MRVSYRWLKSLVPVTDSPQELADKLTFAGLSVEQVEYMNKGITGVVVGEVLEVAAHPDPKKTKLHVCKVNNGKEVLTIVCGAPNVRPGIKVPLALVGADLPGGFHIDVADKAGVMSYGMLCSVSELGMPEELEGKDSEGGIFIVPDECEVGMDIVEALWLDDAILDFELTPNRADCHSVLNIAREVAAITGLPLTLPEIILPEAQGDINDYAKIDVLDKDLCPRYTASLVKDLKIGTSPYWMRHRLAASGIRSINNVVDISNYVLLEMNQPSHTFDYNTLSGHHIIVRRAKEGEKITTLDNAERELNTEMLLICDEERAIGIAGVMGGLDTEIKTTTTDVLIECATFYPKSIRRTSRALGLSSESSARFEKGVDMKEASTASLRIVQLLCKLAGGTYIGGMLDTFDGEYKLPIVTMRFERTRATLGMDVSDAEMEDIIKSLQFKYDKIADGLAVEIPSYRPDITREVDLIEEIARLYGYDKVPVTLPSGEMTQGKKTPTQQREDLAKDVLTSLGFSETITYSFMNKVNYDFIRLPENDQRRTSVKVKNPFSDEQGVMRTTLLPGQLNIVGTNVNHRTLNVSVFEMAHVFQPVQGEKLPNEPVHLCGAVTGSYSKGWNGNVVEKDFFFLKGVLAKVFAAIRIDEWSLDNSEKEPFLHPGRSGHIVVQGKKVGYIGEIHPLVASAYDISQRVIAFEVDFTALGDLVATTNRYKAVSKYPSIDLDLAFVADKDISAASIEGVIKEAAGDRLIKLELFDCYAGDRIETGKKSLAYHLSFCDNTRTMVAEEANEKVEAVKKALEEKFAVTLRA